MSLTMRERILAVFRGETPDVVPFMPDLCHWFCHRTQTPWDLMHSYDAVDHQLLDFHKEKRVGFFIAQLTSFYSVNFTEDVSAQTEKVTINGVPAIKWTLHTPLGQISRARVWQEYSYSWGIHNWGVRTEHELKILGYALTRRTFSSDWGRYHEWADYLGEGGVLYLTPGYSGMGYLLNQWMGIEGTYYAIQDWPKTVREVVEQINESNLACIDLLCQSPAEIILLSDNISSDIQPPHFFQRWSAPYFREAIRRVHAAGKYVAVHIDGRLRGALRMIRDVGADACDGATPTPMGDLTPEECREEAGPDFILSGGISPDLLYANYSMEDLKKAVLRWLDLRRISPRLIMAVGDEMPPGPPDDRIEFIRDLVEEYGRY